MIVLVGYVSKSGQTRAIARQVMHDLTAAGASVELLPLDDADGNDVRRYDAVVLAAAVYANKYPKSLSEFVHQNAAPLNARPTLFLSVSLTAAGHDSADWAGLRSIETNLTKATGWKPTRVIQVAGAYMPSSYDVFTRFIMRRILAERDAGQNPDHDHIYTDWQDLKNEVTVWWQETVQPTLS
ncbi:flavodoxin domain-containing protein [Primorskyibacter sp. S187A]|uniref:flavodoxin domain-containing protein n=1 Tax=Primorskyibacter sp. S187A TaxID=3415130 RepID=UPI003C7DB064